MCGISGIVSFNKSVQLDHLKKMTDVIWYRGPDGEGHWINQKGNIGLGHRRLSILDLSANGSQPMSYLNRYWITFNGEIYNYKEIKSELIDKGYRFKSESDTEVLLACYDLNQEKCLDELDGMFAFAIWDEKKQELFCARDRFGEKPFFFSLYNGQFLFASEMKSLFELGISTSKNLKQYYKYLLYGVNVDVDQPESTFYTDIFQLQPAHYMKVNASGRVETHCYWRIDLNRHMDISLEDAATKFTYLLNESIAKRLRSDVPIGSSLSGGLDSSSIVMSIDQMKQSDLVQKTFSARYKSFVKDEGRFIDLVIQNSNIDPQFVFPSSESVLKNFETIMFHQEEPIGTLSVAAQYEVMHLAKAHDTTVLLDGQGADEVLARIIHKSCAKGLESPF